MLQRAKASLLSIHYKLFLALLVVGLVPTVYTTVRIFLIGQLPSTSGLDIASQMQWVSLLYEIMQEAFIAPLYHFIGQVIRHDWSDYAELADVAELFPDNDNELSNRVRTGLIVVFCLYTLLSIIIIALAEPLIRFMGQDSSLVSETASYIKLETIGAIASTLLQFVTVVLVTIKKEIYLYLLLGLRMVLTVMMDIFLVSELGVSAKMGVGGIAVTNIVVNSLLFGLAVVFLHRENIKVFVWRRLRFAWMKGWSKVGGISGLESFVRNIAFMLMIVRMANIVGEQGTFWVSNNFIWGWLLLPVLQMGELVKRDCGESGNEAIQARTLGYLLLTTVIVIIWFISIPSWKSFGKVVMQLENYEDVYYIMLISVGFYVLFAYNNVIDSSFYGIGKTQYLLVQSLIINIVFYGGAFILYETGVYHPTLTGIALMFAIATGVDSLLTYGMFYWYIRKENLTILVPTNIESTTVTGSQQGAG
jgi:Na+-driven multidrug efflux pump